MMEVKRILLPDCNEWNDVFPFWRALKPGDREEVISKTTAYTVRQSMQGEICAIIPSGCLWAILGGKIDIVVSSIDGQQKKICRLYRGDGGFSMFSAGNGDYSVGVEIKGGTTIAIMQEGLSKELIGQNHEVQRFCLSMNARLVGIMINLIGQISFMPLKERLMRCIEEYSIEQKARDIVVTHEELAKDLGTSREVVSRLLKEMEVTGAVELGRRCIHLR